MADNSTGWISIDLLGRINVFRLVEGSFKAITAIDKNTSDLISLQQRKKYFYKRCMSVVHFLCISQLFSSYQRREMTCFSALWAAWALNERFPFLPFLRSNRSYKFNFKMYLLHAKLLGIIEGKREVVFQMTCSLSLLKLDEAMREATATSANETNLQILLAKLITSARSACPYNFGSPLRCSLSNDYGMQKRNWKFGVLF